MTFSPYMWWKYVSVLAKKEKKLPAGVLPKWLPSELTCLNRDFGIHIASPTVAVDHVAINRQLSLKMNDFRSLQIAVCVDAPWKCARDLEAAWLWNARKTHTLAFGKVHRCSLWVLKVTDSQAEKHRDLFKSFCHPPLSVSCVFLLR